MRRFFLKDGLRLDALFFEAIVPPFLSPLWYKDDFPCPFRLFLKLKKEIPCFCISSACIATEEKRRGVNAVYLSYNESKRKKKTDCVRHKLPARNPLLSIRFDSVNPLGKLLRIICQILWISAFSKGLLWG